MSEPKTLSEVELVDALEATNREIDALTEQDFQKYHMKAKVYGELAYKWRQRCISAGISTAEDRILADEWQGREAEIAALKAELESLRKPLEGELAEDVATVRERLTAFVEARRALPAIDRIEAALRAKGAGKDAFISWFSELEPGEQIDIWYAVDACTHGEAVGVLRSKVDALTSELAALRAKGEPQAAEHHYTNENEIDAVERYDERRRVAAQAAEVEPSLCSKFGWDSEDRRCPVEHPSSCNGMRLEDAARNPSGFMRMCPRVEPGTTLTPGARYRITEIAEWDFDPEHKLGNEFEAGASDKPGTCYPEKAPYWVVGGGTYVTGLELVADAPKEESK